MAKFGDIGEFRTGGTPSSSHPEYYGTEYPWITTVALGSTYIDSSDATAFLSNEGLTNSSTKVIDAGSLMIGIRVGVGKCSINNVPMCTSQDIVSVVGIDKKKYYLPFLVAFVNSKKDYFDTQKRGATIKGITTALIKDLVIPDLSYEKQKEIASVLEGLQLLIEQHGDMLALIDQLVKSRFIEMFGLPGTDTFGWGLVPLGSVCLVNPKKSQDSRLVANLSVSFVPMPAVTEHGEIDATEMRTYDEVKTGFTYFAENDVLFAKITPCMENGKGAVARGLHNGIGFGSTEFHVLRPLKGVSDPRWIYTLTIFPQFRNDAANNMTGSAGQRRVPASFLESYRVAVPPIDLQEQFAAFVTQTDKSKYSYEKEVAA